MEGIKEILVSKIKPKEKILLLAETLKRNKKLLDELFDYIETAKDPEKGTCLSAITEIVKEDPKFIRGYLDSIISYINYKAPRVKWESSEITAHASKVFPVECASAIPKLIKNTSDEGTVVKWSAAFGLTEIAKNNNETRKELIPIFKNKVEIEVNNGVKKLYIKALRYMEKEK